MRSKLKLKKTFSWLNGYAQKVTTTDAQYYTSKNFWHLNTCNTKHLKVGNLNSLPS